MKKNLLFLLTLFLLVINKNAKAGIPNWQVNSSNYAYQMAIVGGLNIDGKESLDKNDILAAFIDGECRGVGKPVYISAVKRYLVYMNIYHDAGQGQITFKIYDASEDRELSLEQTEGFEIQAVKGSTAKPIIFSHPRLSSEANIHTFQLIGQDSSSVVGTDIQVVMPFGTDLKNLVAQFTTSPLAKVWVGEKPQNSGETGNNFSSPLIYKVIAADETTEKNYTVTVKFKNAKPFLVTKTVQVSYLAKPGTLVSQLEAGDTDGDKANITFSLADVNGPFELSADGRLTTKQVLINSDILSYELKVMLNDGQSTSEAKLAVTVLKDKELQLEASNLISPNGDGINDFWEIKNGYLFQDYSFHVYDSQGVEVFFRKGYKEQIWDGSFRGRPLPLGTYIYVVQAPYNVKVFKGTINILP